MNKSKHSSASSLPQPSLRRFPMYFAYLKEQADSGLTRISSSMIAEELNLHPVQVRKDLALTNVSGRPRTGFNIQDLLTDIRRLLDYDHIKPAILVGCGHLGSALVAYRGFAEFGLRLIAACDSNPDVVGSIIGGIKVAPLEKLMRLIQENDIQIGIITTPAPAAQRVCDYMIEAGIKAVWNFAPIHLNVPKNVILQHENIAVSLSVLSKRLYDSQTEETENDTKAP